MIKTSLQADEKIVWKVVRIDGNSLVSASVRAPDSFKNQIYIEYSTNDFVSPKIEKSKIFAFRTRAAARRYKGTGQEFRIYKSIGKNVEKASRRWYYEIWDIDGFNSTMKFWRDYSDVNKRQEYGIDVPNETVYCDALKLIEKA